MTHESYVQRFYDSAMHCYQDIMGDHWHHGDPDALAVGLSRQRSCEIIVERIVTLTGLPAGGKALDFGSGIGGPTLHMARFSGASFTGVNNNDRQNAVARKKATETGLAERVTFLTIDDLGYQSLPFEDATLDAVTFIESVCHLTDKAALFREVQRVLKPGGRLGGIDWIQRPFGEHQREDQIMRLMGPVNELIAIPWHGTVAGYADMMKDSGLDVFIARDLFPGVLCWSSPQDEQRPQWTKYSGPEGKLFRDGDAALMAACKAGVFSVGMWVAGKRP
jgi:tocopherol O-methyltransferase